MSTHPLQTMPMPPASPNLYPGTPPAVTGLNPVEMQPSLPHGGMNTPQPFPNPSELLKAYSGLEQTNGFQVPGQAFTQPSQPSSPPFGNEVNPFQLNALSNAGPTAGPVPNMTEAQAMQFLQEMMAQQPNGPQSPPPEANPALMNLPEATPSAIVVNPETHLAEDKSNGPAPNFMESPDASPLSPFGKLLDATWKKVTAGVIALAAILGIIALAMRGGEKEEEASPSEKTPPTAPTAPKA